MKKIIFLPLFLCMLAIILSCKKEIKVTGTASPLVSVNDVRALYTGSPKVLTSEDMLGASYINGIVISDPANGNAPDGLVILQSFKRKLLRGIALELGDAAVGYNPGDSLVVRIEGKTLDRINGILQISDIQPDDVTKVSEGNEQHINITTTTFTDITRWIDMYESTLVSIKSVITPEMEFGDVFEGIVTLSDWSNTMDLLTKPIASFAADPVPGFGNYTGIIMKDVSEKPILMLRSANEYESQALEPYHPGELYMNFPESWENYDGTRQGGYTNKYETYPTGEWYLTNGYVFDSANIKNKTGKWTVMTRGGVTMNFNLPYGASKFSFDYGTATDTDPIPMTIKVEYSDDSGGTWKQLGTDQVINDTKQHTFSQDLDISGPVRFRIMRESAVSTSRVSIDQIAVYQN